MNSSRLCHNGNHQLVRNIDEMIGFRCIECPLTIPTTLVHSVSFRGYAALNAHNLDRRIVEQAEREWFIKELES